MKFLIFSDIHTSNYKAFTTYKNGVNSRLQSILSCIEKIQDIGKKEEIDFYLFGGDVFHTQGYVDSDVFNLTFDVFSKFDKPVVCVAGNHDNYGSEQSFNVSFQKFSNLPNIQILDYESYDDIVCGVGYHKKYDTDLIKSSKCKILLMHDTPKGLNLNGYVYEEGVDWKSLEQYYDLILFGHIHQPKKMSDKTYVIGSPLEHSFADSATNERGVWLYDNGKMEFIPLGFPKFIKADTLTEDIKKDKYNYYMISSSDEKLEQDNIIVAKGMDDIKIQSRLGSTSMSNESIIDKYVEVCDVKDIGYIVYGKEVLNDSASKTLNIAPSNYILSKVSIEGFLSFKDKVELEIRNGIWLVTGRSEVFASNGAGKTNLFDAIFWCLYGRTTKNLLSDDVINDNLNEDCKVTLDLVKDEDKLTIERYRKYKKQGNGICITLNGIPLDGNTSMLEKKIVNLLGYDYDFFLNAIYYSQEKTEFFASSTDATKKSFLDVILQLDKYDIAVKKVRNDLDNIDKEISSIETQITYIEKDIAELHIKVGEYLLQEQSFEKERNIEIDELINKAAKLCQSLKELNTTFGNIDLELPKYKDKYEKIRSSIADLVDKENKDISVFEKELASINSEIRVLESIVLKTLQKIDGIKDLKDATYCDVCGSVITNDNKELCITREKSELKKVEERLGILNDKRMLATESIKHLDSSYANDIDEYKVAQEALYEKITSLETEYKKQTSAKSSLAYDIKSTEERIGNKSKEVNIYSEKVKDLKIEQSTKKENIRELHISFKENTGKKQVLDFWAKGFSNKGIKSLLLDDFCTMFNKEILTYINLLSNGSMAVGLTNQTKLKSGEIAEKLSLKANLLGKDKSYEQLSGGEKRRVDIAVIVTLNKIIRQMYNISNGLLGMLILDEVFSFLDDTGEENIFYLLKEIIKETKSIFVITHTDELKSYFDNTIVVVKKDRNSCIERS